MKQLIQRMAVTCAVFFLLCVNAIAQAGKSTNNIHGVVLAKEEVTLKSDETKEIKISVLEKHRTPIIMIHENCIAPKIENKYFTATIEKNEEGYCVKLKAKAIKEKKTETIYFKAMKIAPTKDKKVPTEQSSNMGSKWGVPLIVKISPK